MTKDKFVKQKSFIKEFKCDCGLIHKFGGGRGIVKNELHCRCGIVHVRIVKKGDIDE